MKEKGRRRRGEEKEKEGKKERKESEVGEPNGFSPFPNCGGDWGLIKKERREGTTSTLLFENARKTTHCVIDYSIARKWK